MESNIGNALADYFNGTTADEATNTLAQMLDNTIIHGQLNERQTANVAQATIKLIQLLYKVEKCIRN